MGSMFGILLLFLLILCRDFYKPNQYNGHRYVNGLRVMLVVINKIMQIIWYSQCKYWCYSEWCGFPYKLVCSSLHKCSKYAAAVHGVLRSFLQCFSSWSSSSGLYVISLLSSYASSTFSERWWVTFWIFDAKGGSKREEVMLKQRGVIKRSDADASVEQRLILDFKSYIALHCIIAYLSIFMNLWVCFVFVYVLLNLRFVIVLNYVGFLIYVLYNYWWFMSSWMMRILSLKNAIQWIYENLLPHCIHIDKVISSLLLKFCA
jgi:hypothetical protein